MNCFPNAMKESINDILFELKNLVFSYNGLDDKVLEIEELTIPRGHLIVIVGRSGIGKSTFLEVLGLMNNPIINSDNTVFNFYHNSSDRPICFNSIWGEASDKEISLIRNRHFNFIFQETNLMENFTAFENIYLTLMFQGFSKNQSMLIAKNYISELNMND